MASCGNPDCKCGTSTQENEAPVRAFSTTVVPTYPDIIRVQKTEHVGCLPPGMARTISVPKDKRIGGILLDAHETINGPRNDTYGNPIESHQRIAAMWGVYLGTPVTAKDAAMMLLLLKVSRAKTDPDIDSIRDIAGYAGIAADIHLEGQGHD